MPELSDDSYEILYKLLEIDPAKRLSSHELHKIFRRTMTFIRAERRYVYDEE